MHYYNGALEVRLGYVSYKLFNWLLDKEAVAKKNNKDIWDVEEIVEGAEFDDSSDPRPRPE